jgi:hypothetical protein
MISVRKETKTASLFTEAFGMVRNLDKKKAINASFSLELFYK